MASSSFAPAEIHREQWTCAVKPHKSGHNHQLFPKRRLQTPNPADAQDVVSLKRTGGCVLQMGGVILIYTIDLRQFAWNLFIQIDWVKGDDN